LLLLLLLLMVLFVFSQQNLLQMMILRLDFCVAWGKSDGWMQDCRYCISIRAILLFRLADESVTLYYHVFSFFPFRFPTSSRHRIDHNGRRSQQYEYGIYI